MTTVWNPSDVGDRLRDGVEQGRLLGLFSDEPGDLEEAAKAVDGRRVLGHGCDGRIGQAGAGVYGRPLGLSGLCGNWLSGNRCLLQYLQFLPLLVGRPASPRRHSRAGHCACDRPRLRRDDLGDGRLAHLPLARRRPQLARAGAHRRGRGGIPREARRGRRRHACGRRRLRRRAPRRAPGREVDRRHLVAVLPHEQALRARSSGGAVALGARRPAVGAASGGGPPDRLRSGVGGTRRSAEGPTWSTSRCGSAGLWRSADFGASFRRLPGVRMRPRWRRRPTTTTRVLVADAGRALPFDEPGPHVLGAWRASRASRRSRSTCATT